MRQMLVLLILVGLIVVIPALAFPLLVIIPGLIVLLLPGSISSGGFPCTPQELGTSRVVITKHLLPMMRFPEGIVRLQM
jgi:hypothetical protein